MNEQTVNDFVGHKEEIGEEINWRAAREKMAALEKRNRELEGYMTRPDPLEGYEDHDTPTVADLKRLRAHDREMLQSEMRAKEEMIQEKMVETQYPDYREVISKYAKEAFEQSPILAAALNSAPDKALYAYEIGRRQKMLAGNVPSAAPQADTERYLHNSSLPGNLSSVSGEGQSAAMGESMIWDMNDHDFEEYCRRTGTEI